MYFLVHVNNRTTWRRILFSFMWQIVLKAIKIPKAPTQRCVTITYSGSFSSNFSFNNQQIKKTERGGLVEWRPMLLYEGSKNLIVFWSLFPPSAIVFFYFWILPFLRLWKYLLFQTQCFLLQNGVHTVVCFSVYKILQTHFSREDRRSYDITKWLKKDSRYFQTSSKL